MNKLSTKILVAVFIVCIAGKVNAATITFAGMDWLSFDNTFRQNFNEVSLTLLPGGSREEWRYATSTEVDNLLTTLHAGWVSGSSTANEGIVDELGTLLGYTTLNPPPSVFREVTAITGTRGGGGIFVVGYQLNTGARGEPAGTDFVLKSGSFNKGRSLFSGRPIASFLVKDTAVIPLPAAFWLFGSGLIGLAGFSRINRVRHQK